MRLRHAKAFEEELVAIRTKLEKWLDDPAAKSKLRYYWMLMGQLHAVGSLVERISPSATPKCVVEEVSRISVLLKDPKNPLPMQDELS